MPESIKCPDGSLYLTGLLFIPAYLSLRSTPEVKRSGAGLDALGLQRDDGVRLGEAVKISSGSNLRTGTMLVCPQQKEWLEPPFNKHRPLLTPIYD